MSFGSSLVSSPLPPPPLTSDDDDNKDSQDNKKYQPPQSYEPYVPPYPSLLSLKAKLQSKPFNACAIKSPRPVSPPNPAWVSEELRSLTLVDPPSVVKDSLQVLQGLSATISSHESTLAAIIALSVPRPPETAKGATPTSLAREVGELRSHLSELEGPVAMYDRVSSLESDMETRDVVELREGVDEVEGWFRANARGLAAGSEYEGRVEALRARLEGRAIGSLEAKVERLLSSSPSARGGGVGGTSSFSSSSAAGGGSAGAAGYDRSVVRWLSAAKGFRVALSAIKTERGLDKARSMFLKAREKEGKRAMADVAGGAAGGGVRGVAGRMRRVEGSEREVIAAFLGPPALAGEDRADVADFFSGVFMQGRAEVRRVVLEARGLEEACRVVNELGSEIRGEPEERGKDRCLALCRGDGLERVAFFVRSIVKDVEKYKFDAARDFEPADGDDTGTWFGPLKDVIVAMSRAYGVLSPAVFDDLAKVAVGALIAKIEVSVIESQKQSLRQLRYNEIQFLPCTLADTNMTT